MPQAVPVNPLLETCEPRGGGFDSCQPHHVNQRFSSTRAGPFGFLGLECPICSPFGHRLQIAVRNTRGPFPVTGFAHCGATAATLEAMAQAIFMSWFADFDPVIAKIVAKAEGRDPLPATMSAISGKPDAELDTLAPDQRTQLSAHREDAAGPVADQAEMTTLWAHPPP